MVPLAQKLAVRFNAPNMATLQWSPLEARCFWAQPKKCESPGANRSFQGPGDLSPDPFLE